MNVEHFIAQKVAASGHQSFSRLIIRIATAAIALCLAVMICATAMISGFKKEISDKIFGFNGHIQITGFKGVGSGVAYETPPISKNQDFYPDLGNMPPLAYRAKRELFGMELPGGYYETRTKGGIRHIQVFALQPGIIKTRREIEGIVLKGIGEDYDWSFIEQFMLRGATLPLKSEQAERRIMISEQTANRLEVDTGSYFIVHFIKGQEQIKRRLQVSGIYRTGLAEFDKGFALVDIRFLQQLNGWTSEEVGGFELFLDDLDDLDIITEYVYLEELPSNLAGENIKRILPNLFGWLDFQNINEVVILTLMIAVCIINMITALLILILERTNMIGTLKAIGANNWSIRKIFLYHAAYIIGVGLLWGNLIGIGFCLLEDYFHFITLSEENYYLSYAPIDLNFWTILFLNLGTLVLTLTFLIIPTWLVTKINPVEAIRFS